ncbi:CaiB/BaiF CoA-transferase family protein, partial [uncultured Pseudacidovorax sp.]|uniref:CaiB/BaiF CoA transferase family protein n=1 Tax=uncultured Pseudacidovorax sp. TaxID=679313 RepID=UPI0025F4F3B9
VAGADALIEGFRPGVMERLGLGPEVCLEAHPRLVYGRVTGWGRTGPLAPRAGHDINYLALSGALDAIGSRGGPPVPPLNLVADYGGGAMFLAFGLVCALLESARSGKGQIVDVAMTDAVASLMTAFHGLREAGHWRDERGTNLLDGGAPFYGTFATLDGGFMAVGPIEPAFFGQLLTGLGLRAEDFADRMSMQHWPQLRQAIAQAFASHTRAHWETTFETSDACVTPVLSLGEASGHPHHIARGTYVRFNGVEQAAPTPRFSRTPGSLRRAPPRAGEHGRALLAQCGYSTAQIDRLESLGVMAPGIGVPPHQQTTIRQETT